MSKKKEAREYAIVVPGREVPVVSGTAVVHVYPIGFRHMKQFSKAIMQCINYMMDAVNLKKGASEGEIGSAIIAQLGPYVMVNLLDLVAACVKSDDVDVEELPHWDWAAIMEAWIDESFGDEKKWRPWVAQIEKLLAKATGTKISLSEMLSKASSQLDTPSTT